jgi:DNA-binding HxlR family transcriptional regulator
LDVTGITSKALLEHLRRLREENFIKKDRMGFTS